MKKLTAFQILDIQSLSKNPLIYSTDIEFFNDGQSRITITSAINAEWDGQTGVDALLNSALDEFFPNLEYRGLPTKEYSPIDGTDHEYYFIDFEGETLISLIMRSEPKNEWTVEDILRQEA